MDDITAPATGQVPEFCSPSTTPLRMSHCFLDGLPDPSAQTSGKVLLLIVKLVCGIGIYKSKLATSASYLN